MNLDNPIAVRLVVDAGCTPLRGVVEYDDRPAAEFQGMLQLMELLGRLAEAENPTPHNSRTSS
ncbi:hypothetical protein F0U44_05485 [Nocardioides humilatus]|uniref:Uncharacterized protein n=1 Tax=Nocardioides humilatus TaxID=2607660 RepID=A0A5B1LLS6_9ACTN|nr:hypothetical protein [Nocardioides humilatus]KAA1421725.1 hypothetical protein F0U44_05485 [Nocardioides humilatus]